MTHIGGFNWICSDGVYDVWSREGRQVTKELPTPSPKMNRDYI